MPTSFHPPGIRSMAEIDVADVSYPDESVVIDGVVSPSSQGGWPGRDDTYSVHCFTFAAWHRPGEPAIRRELTILRAVPRDTNYWGDFPKYSIWRISAWVSPDGTRAIFEKALPLATSNEELHLIATELQKPVVVSTRRFGSLVLDRSVNWFEGGAEWNGKKVQVTFPVDNEKPAEDALQAAERLWSDQTAWNERIENCAVRDLLDLKNEGWLDEGEPELTADAFIQRMELQSISVSSDGSFEFWYDDGDLFSRHSIMVSGDVEQGPTDAGIHG